MQYRLVVVALALMVAGCATDAEPDCDVEPIDLVVDIAILGLDPDLTYRFDVEIVGGRLVMSQGPSQSSDFEEVPIDGERALMGTLFDSTLRVFIADRDGRDSAPDAVTVTVSSGGEALARRAFRPDYASAVPSDPADCGGFEIVTEELEVPTH
jgi:hypothetical protein